MKRHGLALTTLAFLGLALILPEPSFARGPSFRPAFTGGPFRIVLPTGRGHGHGHFGPRIGKPAGTMPARAALPATSPQKSSPAPVTRTVAHGTTPFRMHRRGYRGSYYPVTVGGDGAYYGSPYDPSDIPASAPLTADDDLVPPKLPRMAQERGCRAQQVTVPNATRAGESAITIVRC